MFAFSCGYSTCGRGCEYSDSAVAVDINLLGVLVRLQN